MIAINIVPITLFRKMIKTCLLGNLFNLILLANVIMNTITKNSSAINNVFALIISKIGKSVSPSISNIVPF